MNEKGESELEATLSGTMIEKKLKIKSLFNCLSASLSHSMGKKNCIHHELLWVDGHSLFNIWHNPSNPWVHSILVITEFQKQAKLIEAVFSVYNVILVWRYISLKSWVIRCKNASSWQSLLTEVILCILKHIKP